MFEVVNAASGMRLPIVMNVVNRALSSPINIHCDHSDSMACRDAGWVQIYSEDAQEVYENNFLAVRISENPDVMLPTMVMQDGFITSHSKQNMVLYPQNKIKKLLGVYKPKNYLLKGEPVTFGSLALTDYFFEIKRQQEEGMRNVFEAFKKAAKELKEITGKNYDFIETYKTNDAETILVALNSTIATSRVVVDKLRKQGKKVGLLKIILFRPFPYEVISKAISKCKNLIVLDRSMSFGAYPPLASEMINVIHDYNLKLNMQNYIYGLGGREIYEEDIENIFNVLKTKKVRNEFIGLRE
jgi:pyruvate ferredoxin oxidoreductase alpha subunit